MFRFKFTQPGKSHLAELCADSEDAALVAPAEEEEGNNGEWIGTGIEIARHLNSTFVAFLMMFHGRRSSVSASQQAGGRIKGDHEI